MSGYGRQHAEQYQGDKPAPMSWRKQAVHVDMSPFNRPRITEPGVRRALCQPGLFTVRRRSHALYAAQELSVAARMAKVGSKLAVLEGNLPIDQHGLHGCTTIDHAL